MNEYELKQEERRERLERASDRAILRSNAAHSGVRSIADRIPFGQPILVGHHSERRSRRDAQRIDDGMRKAVESYEESKEYARRAAAVGKGGISSDDPDAIAKLSEKLADLEAGADMTTAAGKAWRKGGWPAVEVLLGPESTANSKAVYAIMPYGNPFNAAGTRAEIRRVKLRIADLEKAKAAAEEPAPEPTVSASGIRIEERRDINRVAIVFGARVSDEEFKVLKGGGWRWSPREKAWLRHLNVQGRHAAKYTVERIEKMRGETP